MEREALGMIECRGLVAMIEAADAAVKSAVLSPIAGKTGYPAEMLELDRDLQADLGVDTESRF